ncbi:ComEC/Rec2 family competence protein [Embleya sp. NBC_00896]|uniref:ComEC/Rec2 family competence protein n=1 Tax=Embleya sp. NBC_00896 TaxID=2975961 RepID=UPI0038690505|nr:MBL fold metallo-hydrolase [Embleya sp. NBC_00896]
MIFVGVGQGDCTLIVFPEPPHGTGEVVLIDCGSTKGAKCLIPGEPQRIVEALENVRHNLNTFVPRKVIDHLFLTHADEDHYNLLIRALQGFTVKDSYYTGALEDYRNGRDKSGGIENATYEWLRSHNAEPLPDCLVYSGPPAGADPTTPWQYGRPIVPLGSDEGLYALAANATGKSAKRRADWQKYLSSLVDPHEKTRLWKELSRYDPNPDSLVLALVYKKNVMVFMGDATRATEDFILDVWAVSALPPFDVTLKLGHHGSDTSSTERWIKLLKPKRLTVSSGTKRFGGIVGIPKRSHLDRVEGWSAAIAPATPHEYIFFDDRGLDDFDAEPTDRSVFTSHVMRNPEWKRPMPEDDRFFCGNWHLTVDAAGNVMTGF